MLAGCGHNRICQTPLQASDGSRIVEKFSTAGPGVIVSSCRCLVTIRVFHRFSTVSTRWQLKPQAKAAKLPVILKRRQQNAVRTQTEPVNSLPATTVRLQYSTVE